MGSSRHQNALNVLPTILILLVSIWGAAAKYSDSFVRHYYDDEDWERVVKNRKFLTQKGRDENAAMLFHRGRNLQSSGFHVAGARTWNILVCLMNWSNHGDRNKLAAADVNALFVGTGRDNPIHPGGSINDYFQEMSQGQFKLNVHVADWVKTTKSETFYTQDGSQGRTQEIQEAFKPVLQALDNTNIDFSQYDSDGDNEIDMTIFLHSGYDGVYPGNDCQTGVSPLERVASHYRLRASQSTWVSKSGYKLGTYVVSPAYYGNCDLEINGIGVIAHEITHAFGIPDLYDTVDFSSTGFLGGIDNYGLMANPWQPGFDSRYPGPLMAWTKIQLGWINPIEITGDGVYSIRAAAEAPDAYVINRGYASGEYLLIENRQAIQGRVDERFFTPGGITIYHIDESIWSLFGFQGVKGNTPKGGPFQGDWPGNGKHYPVALLQADGLYELEQNINGGDTGDLYNSPDQVLGPGNGETVAQNANYPNTDAYAFGTITVTGITIKNFQYTDGTTMSFEVTGMGPPQGPSPTNPPETIPPMAAPSDPPETAPPTAAPSDPVTGTPTGSAAVTSTPISETLAPTPELTAVPETGDSTAAPSTMEAPTAEATEVPTISSSEEAGTVSGVGCEAAIPAFTDGSPMPGSTLESTSIVDTEVCGTNITTPGQWYIFNGTGNVVEISACGLDGSSSFDVSVSVFEGSSCDALTCVTGSTFTDSVCAKSTSLRKRFLQDSTPGFALIADDGSSYYIFVHGHDPTASDGGGFGDFELLVTEKLDQTLPPEDLPEGMNLEKNVTSNAALSLSFDAEYVTIIAPPSNGVASAEDNTTLIYEPNQDFVGADSFSVKQCLEDGNCTEVTVNVNVLAEPNINQKPDEEEKETLPNSEDGSSSGKNGRYALLVLLLLVPLIWYFRKRIRVYCPFAKGKTETNNWDPKQPAGKANTKTLTEQPFLDEEVNHGYTDDEDNDLGNSNNDDEESSEEDSDSDAEEDEATNESQEDEDDDEDSDEDDDSQDVQGDSDEERSCHRDNENIV